ncbi:LysR substrate-binding domain-containing protein [Aliisedimentitalea scapharcae]|uniref:LysR substrate-binding domain-containing protein n=1 Tax=Aliisedimentitalea scapharcae TaxID=1524259 RepID=A0ABZ2XSP6_9RHOB|nr:LysR family transcriptional regulator [Rhodobacteraceae bacterium M382]
MSDLPHVTWLRAFETAARHNSFSAAADELKLTPAAVSQQIRLLEKHLNTQLFVRLPRGVQLTSIGQAYAQTIRKSFNEMIAATTGLFLEKRKRVVRVRASISCAALVIAPRLAQFQSAHPDILVHLTTSIWADRFDEDNLDIDIRYGLGDWKDAHTTHLGHESAVPVCHPEFAKSFGADLSIDRMAQSKVVQIVGSETDWGKLAELHGLEFTAATDWMRTDSSINALQIVMTGEGVTMVLDSFARQYLDQGLLVAPFEYKLPKRRSHYLVVEDRAVQRDEVAIFRNWVMGLYRVGV